MEEVDSRIKVGDLRKVIADLSDDVPVVIFFDNVFETAEEIEIGEAVAIVGGSAVWN